MAKNPWDNDDNDQPEKNPWDQSGVQVPPDLEKILRKSKAKVRNIMSGDKSGKPPSKPINIKFVAVVACVLWLATGIYQVQPQEQGVVLRFGKYIYTTAPGLHYHLPYPFESVLTPNVSRENRIEIGFRTTLDAKRYKGEMSRDVKSENIALTGDENIVEVNFTVTWKVKNAKDFLFNVRDPEATVRIATESAMRDAIGVTPIMEIIADDRKGVQEKAEKTLQRLLDEYKTGITVTSVQLTKADAPSQVIDAFNDVQRAKADKERLSNEAEAFRNDILPRSRGEASEIISAAEAYKSKIVDEAKGETSRFKAVLDEYTRSREVVARRLYLETMEAIYGSVNKVIIDPSTSKTGVMPYLPVNDILKKN